LNRRSALQPTSDDGLPVKIDGQHARPPILIGALEFDIDVTIGGRFRDSRLQRRGIQVCPNIVARLLVSHDETLDQLSIVLIQHANLVGVIQVDFIDVWTDSPHINRLVGEIDCSSNRRQTVVGGANVDASDV
jgi:hypothetical protein